MKAKRVCYSGRVQGVGFRYTTKQIADKYQVAGWVRNLSDGRVELQVTGAASEVSSFLKEIQTTSRLAELIGNIETSDCDSDEIAQYKKTETFSIIR